MMATCKLCGKFRETAHFNIELRQTPVCESCSDAITRQQLDWLFHTRNLSCCEQPATVKASQKQSEGVQR